MTNPLANLRVIVLSICTLPAVACMPQRVPVLAPEFAFHQRDSVEQAFKAGVRDAWRLQNPNRSHGDFALLAAIPLGMLAKRHSTNVWLMPAIWTTAGLGASLSAYRTSREPLPNPPDSMRQHYGFESEVMWQRYRYGYQVVAEQTRQGRLRRGTTFLSLGMLMLLITAEVTNR